MTDFVNADMSEYWNGSGGQKWLEQQDMSGKFLLPFGHGAMNAAAISVGNLVLDIGCGCGDTSFEIARRIGPAGHVHGLDISKPLVAEARAKKTSLDLKNVTFGCGDAQVQEFEAGLFNVVYSRFGVMFFEDPVAAFANIRGALEPGGRLALVCWQPIIDNEWVSLPLAVAAKHLPLPAPSDEGTPGPFSFGEPQRVHRILSKAGFLNIKITAMTQRLSIGNSRDEAVHFLTQMGPAGSVISQADPGAATLSKLQADLRQALAPHDAGEGISLGAAAWVITAHNSAEMT